MSDRPLLPEDEPRRPVVDRHSVAAHQPGAIVATDDRVLIQEWATARGAEPATGEATSTGPAKVDVQDGDAGIRFNFPAARPFRPITWDEWFENFSRHDLMFVYERDTPGRPPTGRYRLVPRHKLSGIVP